METIIKENGKIIKKMARVSIFMLIQGIFIQENGKIMLDMAKVNAHGSNIILYF